MINEHSSISADGPPVYPFKFVIPVAGALLLLQGLVEIVRCIRCLQTGKWPRRSTDVEEVDVDKLKEMVNVSDADIQALDKYVIEGDHARREAKPVRKELWFGLVLVAIILVGTAIILPNPSDMTRGHIGLLMLALVVVTIMLGFPTAFTLMGMGMLFTWFAFDFNTELALDLMVQRDLRRHDQRRPHLGAALRLHGLPGRARQSDREAVPESPSRHRLAAGLAGGRDAGHLRDLRHRDRHRRRGGDA